MKPSRTDLEHTMHLLQSQTLKAGLDATADPQSNLKPADLQLLWMQQISAQLSLLIDLVAERSDQASR